VVSNICCRFATDSKTIELHYVKVSIQLLHELRDRGLLRLYADFLDYRWKFKNGVVYGNKAEVVSKLGGNRTTTLRKIAKFKQLGWVTTHSGNLKFNNNRTIALIYGVQKNRMHSITKSKMVDSDAILFELYTFLLMEKHVQMNRGFKRFVKGELINEQGHLPMSYYESFYKPYNLGQLQISYDGLGKVWGISKTNAFKAMRELMVRKGLGYEKCYINLTKDLGLPANLELVENTFSSSGSFFIVDEKLYKVQPNKYYWL
jgi:hypothetical protein